MTTTTIMPEGRQRYYNNDGTPCAGGQLWTYAAGTTNPKPTYADAAGTTPNPNPVPLDAKGEAAIYWDGAYKVNLLQADGQQVTGYPVDNFETDPAGVWGVFSDLDAANGTDLVSYGARSLTNKLDERKTILDYGGSSDGATDNTTALTNLRNAGYTVLRFPRAASGPNKYHFSGAMTAALTANCTVDVEPGVTMDVLDIGYIDPSAKFVRDTHLWLSALQEDYWATPASHIQPASRPMWLGLGEKDFGAILPVLCNTSALTYKQVTSGADAFSTFAPTSTSVSGAIIPIAVNTDYRCGFKRMAPDEELFAQFSAATNATPVSIVRTATSYYGMAANLDDAAQPQVFAKAVSGGTSVTSITYMGMGTHASYAPFKSVWSVRINTLRNFSWLFNGVEVANIDTDDEIIEAGFGGQGAAGGSITVQDWTSTKGKPQRAPKPINIAFFGDSITAPTFHGNWPAQLANVLDLAFGIRVNFIQNYAVSGASSSAQAPLCTAPNIASYDVVCIMLGVNDIQGGATEQTFATNLANMIDVCQGAGKKVVVGLPTLFYGQGQAGAGKGQATTNYDLGKGVRAKCLRTCADKGVAVVNTWGVYGPVLADWVNPTLNSLANLGRDPVVFDSIHPTQTAKLALAKAFASVIAGLLLRSSTLQTELANLPAANLANGWTFSGTTPQWIRDGAGVVFLSGFMLPGTTAAGTVVFTMPENIRPTQTGRYAVRADTGTAALDIDAVTGQVTVYNWPAGAGFVSLDTIRYPSR